MICRYQKALLITLNSLKNKHGWSYFWKKNRPVGNKRKLLVLLFYLVYKQAEWLLFSNSVCLLEGSEYRGSPTYVVFHYRWSHYRDFWLMRIQLGDFGVSWEPHTIPLAQILHIRVRQGALCTLKLLKDFWNGQEHESYFSEKVLKFLVPRNAWMTYYWLWITVIYG